MKGPRHRRRALGGLVVLAALFTTVLVILDLARPDSLIRAGLAGEPRTLEQEERRERVLIPFRRRPPRPQINLAPGDGARPGRVTGREVDGQGRSRERPAERAGVPGARGSRTA